MKLLLKRFIIYGIAILVIFFLQGRTKSIDVTYEEAIDSFHHYEMVVNDFIENPAKEKIPKVSRSGAVFLMNSDDLIEHQTFYNKVFTNEPILTAEEMARLEEVTNIAQELDETYVTTALELVYKASDFSLLIAEAIESGKYKSESIEIKSLNNNFTIIVEGTFHADTTGNILTRYFLIETESGNYYWKRPVNFSMSISDREVSITEGKIKYEIKGKVIY
ncbi:hypothetical protein H1D32_12200 [Anaerobacillus sp. CMMVII]|uniref:hypothetical protein n=1 Tax=Anaerobacillus sp. CMMVII TaxID=2755588 RepID=UPI0021B7968A|nr:hypothetical protein [Anaerobacillus sp. CMMVII]MCT8138439.1 hypothetical protein [Anaerobacillus sp. CMMVII]